MQTGTIEKRYYISEAAKQVQVETHVLRYWEEELELPIRRNDLGHRYYTESDIERLREVKRLKEKGLQLKAIKTILFDQKSNKIMPMENCEEPVKAKDHELQSYQSNDRQLQETKNDKTARLQFLLTQMIAQAVKESNGELMNEMKDSIIKELDYQFRVFGEEEDKRSEEHFKKLDEALRANTNGKQASREKKKKHSIF